MSSINQKINWGQVFSIASLAYTILGVAFALVALKGFMIPNHFLDGGITGICLLIHEEFHINLGILLIIFNLPFILIGYKKISKTFAVQSFLAVILLAISMYFIDVPTVTDDKILIAVFGGLLIGAGIGLVIRGGGVIDGFEIIAHYTNKKYGFSTSEIVMGTNTIIFLCAAYSFGIEAAMYSIITYFAALQTSDYIVDGFEEFTALTIISKEHEKVKSIIVNDFNKAITVYKGERGYLPGSFNVKTDCDIIMTIISRLEIHRMQEAIKEVDENAFFYVNKIKEVKGGIGKHIKAH